MRIKNAIGRNVILSGEIDENSFKEIASQLIELDMKSGIINLYINSVGGNTDAGMGLYDLIMSLSSVVRTVGLGTVASSATLVFLAGDTREILPNTEFMIHGCHYSDLGGNVEEIDQYKKLAVSLNEKMINIYRGFNNKPLSWWRNKIKKDWYLTPEEIISLGFLS